MWSDAWRQLIEAIHAKGFPTVLVVTGGGASAISELLVVPGASRTVLDACVPYAQEALWEWLGRKPDHACDARTARAMASVACHRGLKLMAMAADGSTVSVGRTSSVDGPVERHCAGLSCTASLASDRPKKGDHRLFAAIQTPRLTASVTIIFVKGTRTRAAEEALTGQILIRLLAETLEMKSIPPFDLFDSEVLVAHRCLADPRLAEVWSGRAPLVWSLPNATFAETPQTPIGGLLCGAFDPLHQGHEILRSVAESCLGKPVAYEISITNVDKPPLDFLSIEERRQQFFGKAPLVLTNAPRFLHKAKVLPGTTFVIGSDTAERLLNAQYDGGTQESLNGVLEEIRQTGCRFLVAFRVVRGQPLRLQDLTVPPQFRDLFEEIPESQFRVDLSSTELRANYN